VLPRRSASCRRRASSSSGSFTVVRRMYASILRDRKCRQGAHFAAVFTTPALQRPQHRGPYRAPGNHVR
jgi:hypothetical protein